MEGQQPAVDGYPQYVAQAQSTNSKDQKTEAAPLSPYIAELKSPRSSQPLTHLSEPVEKLPSPEYQQHVAIGPDENPLTPTTPKSISRRINTTNMAVIQPTVNQPAYAPAALTPQPQAIRGGSWQHSLCSCAEPSICMTSLFCPCVVYGKTQYRLGLKSNKKDPTNMLGYTAVNGSCIAFGILCGINGFLSAIQRTRLRKSYEMSPESGNMTGDCLKGLCCCCCVVAQNEKEVSCREQEARKAGENPKIEGYVPPGGMTFAAPPR